MEFLKKHYEKVLLGLVVLGMTVAVGALLFIIPEKRDKLRALSDAKTNPKIKPFPPLDMAVEEAALQRVQTPVRLDFTTKHNLFNPVLWQKTADGRLVKILTGNEVGPGALEILAIKPLYLRLTYSSPSETGYQITVEREAASRESQRHTSTIVSKENNKSELLDLQGVVGPPEKPTELVLELKDSGEVIHLSPDKPYQEAQDYTVDLRYALENRTWRSQRTNSPPLVFAGGQYKIVAITESNVVFSAQSNNKKTTKTFNPATEPTR